MTWELVHPELNLYCYICDGQQSADKGMPILMLHSTLASHESWTPMADYLCEAGASPVYAVDVKEFQVETPDAKMALTYVREAMFYILHKAAAYEQMILVGYGAGGTLAYRYWQTWAEDKTLAYLFTIASPLSSTTFRLLEEQSFNSSRGTNIETTDPIDFNRISAVQERSSTILINIFGDAVGVDFDGVVRGLRLPEAANFVFPLRHEEMNKDKHVADMLLECLRGEQFIVKLKVVGMQMRRDDGDGRSGPVVFDIDGERMPADVVFQPITDRMYLFEEAVPPLCTLSYPITAVSANITLHLRDLSTMSGRRRRMYIRLHIPLIHEDSTAHTMQDSEGSDFLWRIVCKQMPTVLGEAWYEKYSQQIIRGI
jgi:pimeloyl-ACP methyl ester carboxylesterase